MTYDVEEYTVHSDIQLGVMRVIAPTPNTSADSQVLEICPRDNWI
jgi:hypothetical protein